MKAPNTGAAYVRPYFSRSVWNEVLKKNPDLAQKIVDNSTTRWTIFGVYRIGCPQELIRQAYETLG